MNKPSFMIRAQVALAAALETFRYGFPGDSKRLPFQWPAWRQLQPQWHLTDYNAYVNEGFTFNELVYAAIMCKVMAVIPAPLRAYTGDPDYPEALPPTNALSKLVTRPNKHQSWTEFHSQNVVYLNLDGNVYIYKDRKNKEMHSLRPDRMYVVPNQKKRRADLKGFVYVPEGGSVHSGIPFLPKDIIHIKFPNPGDPLEGYGYGLSPLSAAARTADVDNMVTNFLNVFFESGTMMTGVLSFDTPLRASVVDTIRERWKKKYGGYENWDIGVLDRGGKYQRLGLTFEEMGFAELDARNECRVLSVFGVPPILVGSRVGLERSTYSNYGEARKAFWEDRLLPEIYMFQVEYQHHLKGRNAFVKFDLSQVPALQKDLPVLASAAYTLVQIGVPPSQALAAVGLRIGEFPGGDVSRILADRGQEQGPRADAEDDSWGQRALPDGSNGPILELEAS